MAKAIRIEDLSPDYQRKVAEEILAKERTRAAKQRGGARKYHNEPAVRTTPDGHVLRFDSKREARRYDQLYALLEAGQIRALRLQVDFTLSEAWTDPKGVRHRAERYRADFTYEELSPSGWIQVVEDAKGIKTPLYLSKKKRLAMQGIEIREV